MRLFLLKHGGDGGDEYFPPQALIKCAITEQLFVYRSLNQNIEGAGGQSSRRR
jgi:hypothetical protein